MKAISNHAECPRCKGGHKSKPFCVFANGYYCFSCGLSKSSDRSFSFRELQAENPHYPELSDCITTYSLFSIASLQWLTKFHVTQEMTRKYDIRQFPDGSLVYLNIQDNIVTGYQRRWLGKERNIITKGAKSPSFFSAENEIIVLCEDYLSAIRVNKHYNTCCLWGTKLDYETVKYIVNTYKNIYIWLDNDCNKYVNSGQIAAEKLYKMFESAILFKNRRRWEAQQTITNIVTEQDPKCYVDSEIIEIIGEHYV